MSPRTPRTAHGLTGPGSLAGPGPLELTRNLGRETGRTNNLRGNKMRACQENCPRGDRMVSGWGLVPDDQRNEMKRRGGVLVCIEGGLLLVLIGFAGGMAHWGGSESLPWSPEWVPCTRMPRNGAPRNARLRRNPRFAPTSCVSLVASTGTRIMESRRIPGSPLKRGRRSQGCTLAAPPDSPTG